MLLIGLLDRIVKMGDLVFFLKRLKINQDSKFIKISILQCKRKLRQSIVEYNHTYKLNYIQGILVALLGAGVCYGLQSVCVKQLSMQESCDPFLNVTKNSYLKISIIKIS